MATTGRVNWYEEEARLAVGEATDEFLKKLAFQGEGYAKVGAPVDTGFMRNAIYGLGPGGTHRRAAVAEARGTEGAGARVLADAPRLDEHTAAIHGAADYTIHQEERVGFLYGALEKLKGIAGGVIETVKL
jgi:hypothetical protein